MRLARRVNIRESVGVEFRLEAFNAFNRRLNLDLDSAGYVYADPGNGGCPAGNANTCLVELDTFQQVTSTGSPRLGARQLQFGINLSF
jgi:hypothetical protein